MQKIIQIYEYTYKYISKELYMLMYVYYIIINMKNRLAFKLSIDSEFRESN